MKCTDCKYCILQDYGYSNYTVEGTNVDCLLGLNPKFPEDHGWGLEPSLYLAESCQRYAEGHAVDVDCDQDEGDLENYSDDHEIKELLKSY